MDKSDLANWIVRLNAKGEALKAGRGEGDLLRRVALVTCAKSVAEVQLFRQQRSQQQRTRYGSGSSGGGCSNGGGNGGRLPNRLKRSHSSSFSSDGGPVSGCGPDASGGGSGACSCDSCSLCSKYQAAGANSCYCRAIGYAASPKPPTHLLSDDEESKLIDDFLTSLDGVPSKKCKRL